MGVAERAAMKKTSFLLVALLAGACSNPPSEGTDAGRDAPDTGRDAPDTGQDAAPGDAGGPTPDAGWDGGPRPPTPDAGPPLPAVACDTLPATVTSEPVDVYYKAVQLCGLPGGDCVVQSARRGLECSGGAHVLVGYDGTDAGQVRVQNDWTIASATAGMSTSPQQQWSIPTDAEASVVLEAPDGARYALTFVIGRDDVRVVSFTAVAP
jgi:hypothetical protein